MKRFFILLGVLFLFAEKPSYSQTLNPFYQSIVANAKYDSILNYLERFENFGVKETGSIELSDAGMWIYNKYLSYGYSVKRDTFSFFGNTFFNVVATKTGTIEPNTYVIVGAHYDSKNGSGTNDNGSGTAILLEAARIMAATPTAFSVRFISFSAEEIGLVGSNHYVDDIVVPQAMQIRVMFNIDEVGGVAGEINDTITCEEDDSNSPPSNNATSALYTDTLENLTYLYSSLFAKRASAYSSDYMPFEDAGYIITGYYETNESSVPHSSSDLLENLDTSYVFEISRAATGAILYFAQAYDPGVYASSARISEIKVWPNPVMDEINISSAANEILKATLYSQLGQNLKSIDLPVNYTTKMDLSNIASGLYSVKISNVNGEIVNILKVVKQ
ncbi:MAG: M28 family peptidase [Bacteroidota bacterium]